MNFTRVFRNAYEILRAPDRQPKCYDMTETERDNAIVRLNRNVWNDPNLAQQDQFKIEQPYNLRN